MGGFTESWLEEWMDGMVGWYLSRTDERHQSIDSSKCSVNFKQCKHKHCYI